MPSNDAGHRPHSRWYQVREAEVSPETADELLLALGREPEDPCGIEAVREVARIVGSMDGLRHAMDDAPRRVVIAEQLSMVLKQLEPLICTLTSLHEDVRLAFAASGLDGKTSARLIAWGLPWNPEPLEDRFRRVRDVDETDAPCASLDELFLLQLLHALYRAATQAKARWEPDRGGQIAERSLGCALMLADLIFGRCHGPDSNRESARASFLGTVLSLVDPSRKSDNPTDLARRALRLLRDEWKRRNRRRPRSLTPFRTHPKPGSHGKTRTRSKS